jgi:hypothetical protein
VGAHGAATRLFSAVLVILGLVMVVSTIVRGGGPLASGIVLGVLFTAAGALRLYAATRSSR